MYIRITIGLVLVNFVQFLQSSRLPLEVFEVNSSSQVYDEDHIVREKQHHQLQQQQHNQQQKDNTPIAQRKPRQMDEMQTLRVLYQVGSSEDDLPICAPNAVCSKIDLYESPWIERQCRCPSSESASSSSQRHSPHVIYHHKDVKQQPPQYQHFYSENKNRPQRILDIDDTNSAENKHFKELLKKLGATYNVDDIILDDVDADGGGAGGGGGGGGTGVGGGIVNNESLDHNSNFLYRHKMASKRKDSSTISRNNNNNNNSRHRSENVLEMHETTKKFRHAAHRLDFPTIGGCSSSIGIDDGHTIADKTRHYKLCEPVHNLKTCSYFRDYTWTLKSSPDANATEQIVHCKCPRNSVTYLIKREPLEAGKLGYTYLFACSPQSRLRCQRKEPCKLFTVRKRQEFLDEVNTNPLCQCPRGHSCPKHHTDSGVIAGKSYIEDNIRTYSGYCMADY